MKRICAFFVTFLAISPPSFAATYHNKKLDDKPLKCSLSTMDQTHIQDVTCIFHSNNPDNVEVMTDSPTRKGKVTGKLYKFNSIDGKIFDLKRVAIYQNDEHNFDIYGVLRISLPNEKPIN